MMDGGTAGQRDGESRALAAARRSCGGLATAGALLALGACDPAESALTPAGPQAGRIATLWWVWLSVLVAIYVLVLAALAWATFRRRRETDDIGERPEIDRKLGRGLAGVTAVIVLILFAFLIADVLTGRSLHALASRPNPVKITLVGHQWWWEARYDEGTTYGFTTANELHIPVGRPVEIIGKSEDVIQSFWVAPLHGKRDLIPGHVTTLWLQADRPGVYRGQCAEFCGLQHAHMAIYVIAQPPAQYDQWRAQQADTARAPATPQAQQGRQVFLSTSCSLCHTIRGTSAGSNNGPDLTHVASRMTLAAGTLPNGPGGLLGWIVDPHSVKPGANMPGNALSSQDLQALLAYLGGLR